MYQFNYPNIEEVNYCPLVYSYSPLPCYNDNYRSTEPSNEPEEKIEEKAESNEEDTRNKAVSNKPETMQSPPAMEFSSFTPMQPGMQTQMPAMSQDAFIAVIKQIETETPEIIKVLVSLGLAIETSREIIFRIIQAAQNPSK
jgi:hypothetical protein